MEVRAFRRAKVRPEAAAPKQMDGCVFASGGNLPHRKYLGMAASTFKPLV